MRPRAFEARQGQGRRRIVPIVARACDASLRSWQPVPLCSWTWMVSLVIHQIRHADDPCGLAPLDALLGGVFPCRALSGLFVWAACVYKL